MMKNEIIPFKQNTQFLEMPLNSRLKWDEHINKLRAKEKGALNTISVVAGEKKQKNQKNIVQCNILDIR